LFPLRFLVKEGKALSELGVWYPGYIRTEIIYIPGHAGIRFNERADKLAGAAEAFGDLELTDGS
jgi:hypothetical protein